MFTEQNRSEQNISILCLHVTLVTKAQLQTYMCDIVHVSRYCIVSSFRVDLVVLELF